MTRKPRILSKGRAKDRPNNQTPGPKSRVIATAGLAVLGCSVLLTLAIWKHDAILETEPTSGGTNAARPEVEVRGIDLERVVNGTRLYRLKVGKFELGKKKSVFSASGG